MRPWLTEVANAPIDNLAGKHRVDLVDDFAYPLPVTAICRHPAAWPPGPRHFL